MKILYVSTSPLEYSASSNMRNVALLKGIIENGHKIYTLTPEPQKDSELYDENLCNIDIEKKYFLTMSKLHSSMTVKKESKNSFKDKIKKFLKERLKKVKIYDFRSSLAKQKILIEEKFDIIISSSDPKSSHLVAKNLIKNNKNITKKWIQYWGDPFADDINDNRRLFKFFVKNEERKLIKVADEIVYVSPFTLKKQQKIFSKYSDKMRFLPIPYSHELIYDYAKNDTFSLGYFGDYYSRNRNIMPLYDFVRNNKNINLNICGNSDLKLIETENIIISSRQSIDKIREYESNSDVLICVCNSSGTQIPGKVYHYAATNKPILIILDGENKEELKKYFEQFDRYELCYNDEDEIKCAIYNIMNKNKEYSPCEILYASNIATRFIDV